MSYVLIAGYDMQATKEEIAEMLGEEKPIFVATVGSPCWVAPPVGMQISINGGPPQDGPVQVWKGDQIAVVERQAR